MRGWRLTTPKATGLDSASRGYGCGSKVAWLVYPFVLLVEVPIKKWIWLAISFVLCKQEGEDFEGVEGAKSPKTSHFRFCYWFGQGQNGCGQSCMPIYPFLLLVEVPIKKWIWLTSFSFLLCIWREGRFWGSGKLRTLKIAIIDSATDLDRDKMVVAKAAWLIYPFVLLVEVQIKKMNMTD